MPTKTVTIGQSGTRPYGVLTVEQTAQSVANNSSTVTASLVLKRPSAVSSTATKTASVTINGTIFSWSGSIGGSGDKTLISKTITVPHNSDGSKTISFSASIALEITWSGVSLGTIKGSGALALDKIARYATARQALASKTETSAVISWSSDTIIDYIWYSTTNGGSWKGINVADGKTGSYTIGGLAANTTYQVTTRVRSKDSQLTTDSSVLRVTTYDYPQATNTPNFTIGERVTIGFYNPLGRTATVNLIGADGSTIGTDTITGTTISGYNNATVQGRLYDSIPNASSGRYSVKVTYGSSVTTKQGGIYTVDEAVCEPTIGACTYEDTNTTTVAITGDTQSIVQNRSTVRFSADGLQALMGATVKSCSVNVNGISYPLTVSGSGAAGGSVAINSAQDIEAEFTVTDSRGLSSSKGVTVKMLELSKPSALITLQRQNNYYSETDIEVDADYSSVNGKNTLTISYACTKDGDSAATVSGTLEDGSMQTIELDNNYGWAVTVTLKDRFDMTSTYTQRIARGIPLIYFDRLKSSVGINCFPQRENSLEVAGGVFSDSPKVLWSNETGYFMQGSQTCTLSEPVSSQPNGIVLHWQGYSDGSAVNQNHHYVFVPKTHTTNPNTVGGAVTEMWFYGGGNSAVLKYVYINDANIRGHDNNATTLSGLLSFTNRTSVLTEVLGV